LIATFARERAANSCELWERGTNFRIRYRLSFISFRCRLFLLNTASDAALRHEDSMKTVPS
jgi:hypothetical protein